MRIVFMGTPEAAVPTLQRCVEDGHEVIAVWTQPDRPAGRGEKIREPPVKEFALKHGLTVEQPVKIKSAQAKDLFSSYEADVAIVVAYGRILPEHYLKAPKRGCINVHFSLLPDYRGAAPVNWAIVNGETKTGVSTMFIEQELDAGPILLQQKTEIRPRETAPELMRRLSQLGANLLGETLNRLDDITPLPQRDRDATFAPILKKEDGLIHWSSPATVIENSVRGFQPWPNAYTYYKGQRLIFWAAEPLEHPDEKAGFGEVLSASGDDLLIKTGGGMALRVLELQPEAKRRMSARDFLNGTRVRTGEKFGEI